MMEKTKKVLIFTIQGTVQISAGDVYRLSEVEDMVEHLQGLGEAEIIDVEIVEAEIVDVEIVEEN